MVGGLLQNCEEMARRGGKRYVHALVFTTNPAAADVFHKDEFNDGEKDLVKGEYREVQKKSWKEPTRGLILDVGMQNICKTSFNFYCPTVCCESMFFNFLVFVCVHSRS